MSETYGIDLSKLMNVYAQCVDVDENEIVYLGMSNPYSATMIGNQRALSTGLDNTIRIMFPEPVSQFSCYLTNLIGQPTLIPEVFAYGYQKAYDDVPNQKMKWQISPGRPISGQYSGGTPINDEFLWSYVDIKNCRIWRINYVEAEYV